MFGVIEQLRKTIASRHDEMAELTASLVAIDTENPPGRNYERCLRFLGEKLEELGLEAVVERIKNGAADRRAPARLAPFTGWRWWSHGVLPRPH